jgi:hypothetical protein
MFVEFPKAFGKCPTYSGKGLFCQFRIKCFAMGFLKEWFVIKGVHMAHSSWTKYLDYGIGLCRMMWAFGGNGRFQAFSRSLSPKPTFHMEKPG